MMKSSFLGIIILYSISIFSMEHTVETAIVPEELRDRQNLVNFLDTAKGEEKELGIDEEAIKFLIKEGICNAHEYGVNCLCNLDKNIIVSGSGIGKTSEMKIWNTENKRRLTRVLGHEDSVLCVCELSRGQFASGSADKTIILWNFLKGTGKALMGHENSVLALCRVSDKLLASGSIDKTIKIWNLENFSEAATLRGHKYGVESLCKLDNNRLASGSWEDPIKIWDLSTNQEIATLKDNDEIFDLAFCDDTLISTGRVMKIWDLKTATKIAKLEGHTGSVRCIALLKNNKLASGSTDKTIKIWDLKKGHEIATLKGHNDTINDLCVTSDDKLISGSSDKTIKIWNLGNIISAEEK